MGEIKNIVALDCGNSSFRVVLGRFDGKKITTEVISQTPHDMIKLFDYHYWDILKIFNGFKKDLKTIINRKIKIDSIGISTWGVDFAPFDKDGNMLSNPLSYRNTIGEESFKGLRDKQRAEMFLKTGIICDKINSVYMLDGMKKYFPEIYNVADKILMIPDIINYFLTGVMQNEPSELSTTQLMDSKTKRISRDICDMMSISPSLFSEIGVHGKAIGNILPSVKREIGADYDIPVVCVPSHDTASAVMAIPNREEQFIFISSGTWSLVGTVLEEPIINDEARKWGLTNEVGAFDKITMLKNCAGMFIIQRIKKEYEEAVNKRITWDELDRLAQKNMDKTPLFDVNDDSLFNPPHMGEAIWSYLKSTNQIGGDIDWSVIVKVVHESMACCYAATISAIEKAAGRTFDTIYIVGGGSKNVIVNKLTAKRTGKKVVACSKESTSLGNIVSQLVYHEPGMAMSEIRGILDKSVSCKEYTSRLACNNVNRYLELARCDK